MERGRVFRDAVVSAIGVTRKLHTFRLPGILTAHLSDKRDNSIPRSVPSDIQHAGARWQPGRAFARMANMCMSGRAAREHGRLLSFYRFRPTIAFFSKRSSGARCDADELARSLTLSLPRCGGKGGQTRERAVHAILMN